MQPGAYVGLHQHVVPSVVDDQLAVRKVSDDSVDGSAHPVDVIKRSLCGWKVSRDVKGFWVKAGNAKCHRQKASRECAGRGSRLRWIAQAVRSSNHATRCICKVAPDRVDGLYLRVS